MPEKEKNETECIQQVDSTCKQNVAKWQQLYLQKGEGKSDMPVEDTL